MRLLKFYNKLLISILFICSLRVMAVDKAARIERQINQDINELRTVEEQKEEKAQVHVRKAKDLFIHNQYKKAIDQYLVAVKILKTIGIGNNNSFKKEIKYCEEQVYQCYYYWAMDVVAKVEKKSFSKDYTEAIRLCNKAAEIYPPYKKKMDEKIKKFTILRDAAARRYKTSESKLIPNKKESSYDIQILLKQAQVLIRAGKYNLAKEKYEQVILSDIYNYKAIEGLRLVNTKLRKMGIRRLYTQDKERIAEVSWKMTTPIIPQVRDKRAVIGKPIKKYSAVSKIRQKLQSIIIPRLDFEDITVETAVRHLREQSKQLDPEGVGINIFLRLKAPEVKDSALDAGTAEGDREITTQAGDPAGVGNEEEEEEEEEEEDEEDSEGDEGVEKSVVDLVLVKRNLYQAIYFLCKAADLKFRIEKYAVVIAAKNIALDDLETKIFPVEQGALAAVGGDDTGSLKEYFRDRGIKFPNGAKIVYDSRISRLIATNTLDNLNRLESIIQNELSSKDPMVQIQAKFIEIEQNDLKELGFNWTVQNTPASDNGTFSIGKTDSALASVSSPSPTIARYALDSGGFSLAFDVNALNQVDSRNLLSSPRITTMNGQEASIRMVREVYFPDDYTEAETTTTSGGTSGNDTYSFISSIPEFADPTELGIILRVTPDVDIDHRTITMRVNPTVQAFVTWTDYAYEVSRGEGIAPETVHIVKPVIAARTIDTKITIYDGETIVLGGILKDTTKVINERVPIIGEIPLIGRMFQSIGTESSKVNLLIFLTCRLVKPDGTAFFPDVRPNALAKFKRLK